MPTVLYTISVAAESRGAKDVYSAQVIACNGEKLFHLAEAESISEALEKVVAEMRKREKAGAAFR